MKPSRTPELTRLIEGLRERIPIDQFRFRFGRSSGPGGQNVNKTSTRATAMLPILDGTTFTPAEVARLSRRLASRMDRDGVLSVTCERLRTQGANRREAVERAYAILAAALRVPKVRRATRPTASSVRRRLATKKKASGRKEDRKKPE